MPKHQINYLKAVVIVHGKSEKQICEYIRSNLRLKIEIYSEKAGGKSIQITGLNRIYNSANLEDVLKRAKIPYSNEKSDYIKLFPTNHEKKGQFDEIQELHRKLKSTSDTNLDVLIEFCLNNVEKK